jgi:ubiquinone/menaquinone biosynthesis C-methylase UbiE
MHNTGNLRKYNSKNPLQKLLINNFIKTLLLCLEKLEIKTVLDAGCGEGFILSKLRQKNIGREMEGFDFSEEALSAGKKLFPNLVLRKGDINDMPYENSSFDLVLCTEVMEHLEQPTEALHEIVRVSRKYCLLSVPNEPFFMISNFLRGKNLSRWGNDINHIHHWSSRAFENFIRCELNVIKVKKPFPWTIVLSEKRH